LRAAVIGTVRVAPKSLPGIRDHGKTETMTVEIVLATFLSAR
jgi:hypothetical protein